jgi:hypothetical protein
VDEIDTTVAEVGHELLDGPLDEYVARRKAVARRLRVNGDREAAKAVEGLTKPTVVVFAALRAADDPAMVRAAVDATTEVARVQTGAGDRSDLARASAERRARIDELVDAGLAATGGGGGTGRADEVRAVIDLLTRHDEVLDAWLDGTLRDLPESDAGFASLGLASVSPGGGSPDVGGASRTRSRRDATTGRRSGGTAPGDDVPATPSATERRAREAAETAVERAAAVLAGAETALEEAEDALTDAEATLSEAEAARRAAETAAEEARRARDGAAQRRDAAADDLDERRAALIELDGA